MKVTKEALRDKLKLFALAGFDSEVGWDYAIPQKWADQLRDMGIEDISSHFVTDCTRLLYKLHHTGEAFAAILESRSRTNHDTLRGLMDADDTETFMELIHEFQEVWEEIDAGLLNVNLLAVIFNRAYQAGWDANQKALAPLINGKPGESQSVGTADPS